MNNAYPKWHQELDRFKAFKTTFILEGNIYDLHSFRSGKDGQVDWIPYKLDQYLHQYLVSCGFRTVAFYNHVDGFYNGFDPAHLKDFLSAARNRTLSGTRENRNDSVEQAENEPTKYHNATIDHATEIIRTFLLNRDGGAKAVVLNLASRYIESPETLTAQENLFYSRLFLTTLNPIQVSSEQGFLNNLLFIVVNKANEIPAWFYLNNPYLKIVHIGNPDKYSRTRFIDTQLQFFVGVSGMAGEEIDKHKEKFVDLTDGFKNIELDGLVELCRQENIPINRISEAVALYKYGIKENPWADLSRENKMKEAEAVLRQRVKGQDAAITQTLDIVKRAVSGLSGLQHSSSSSKPKGVLFFAGPTGVGKTELAKTMANLLFGYDNACIRFDMSEYQQPHSDQKLLGAPPGYVGYESGGQLTNAVKEKPFSILLFDEIEKAHTSIFDKFLQILEDGRMTDSQGDTVYFSESIIIFTSNLGIYSWDEGLGTRVPNVVRGKQSYQEMSVKIINAIKDYFIKELGRPEILNRIGENLVVFDFIQDEVAMQILNGQLGKVKNSLYETKMIKLEIRQKALDFIFSKAKDNLDNGGRGIGNMVERHLINPLARFMFNAGIEKNCTLTVKNVLEANNITSLDCEVGYV